jgi:hypothetical protein
VLLEAQSVEQVMQVFMMPLIEQGSFLTLHKVQFQVTFVRRTFNNSYTITLTPSNMQKNPGMAYAAASRKAAPSISWSAAAIGCTSVTVAEVFLTGTSQAGAPGPSKYLWRLRRSSGASQY